MDKINFNYNEVLQLQVLVEHELDFVSSLDKKNDYFISKFETLKNLKEKLTQLALDTMEI